jgi:branched-chain amino acid transport system substrate-binding protein
MKLKLIAATSALVFSMAAQADIAVGVTLSTTGPAASLGIPQKNTVALLPKEVAGQKINYIVLDDASDTTAAVTNARKLTAEHKVDVILGATTSPASLAMIDAVAESETPMISMAAAARIVEPMDAKRKWVFKTTQSDLMMSLAVAESMSAAGVKTVGFIGFADAYGEGWHQEFSKAAELKKLKIVANERFNRTDTSVSGQVLRMVAAKPDAILIVGSGTPAVLPQRTLKERGYAGAIYQTLGVANADFLRVGGKDVEGTLLAVGPVLVANQLPDSHPVKKTAMTYYEAYEKAYGKGTVSTFGGHLWDAAQMVVAATPDALKKGQPGTPAFRAALRERLEQIKDLKASHGVFTTSPTDHLGLDQRARVMVRIQDGTWKLAD